MGRTIGGQGDARVWLRAVHLYPPLRATLVVAEPPEFEVPLTLNNAETPDHSFRGPEQLGMG